MLNAAESELLVEGGPQDKETVTLRGSTVTMGRQPDNDLHVPEAVVSRHHAEIVSTGDGYCVRDLYSSNGTLVNEKRIPEGDYVLRDGDRVRLAASEVSFVFRSATAVTQAQTAVQPPVQGMPPATLQSVDIQAPESDEQEDVEGIYEGTVHLQLLVEGGMGLIFSFTQQLREKPVFRLLRLNNNATGGVDIWLGLREPVRLEDVLLEMASVAEVRPDPESDEPFVRAVLRE